MKGPAARLRGICAGAIAALGLALLPAGASAGGVTTLTDDHRDLRLTSHYKIEVPDP
jgi:hypothetical protein